MNLIMMICCKTMLVSAGRAHYHCTGGRTPIDLKDDTAAEASLRRVTSYLLSWLVPAADPRSAWDALKRSQLSQGNGPSADTTAAHNGGPLQRACDPKIKHIGGSTVRVRHKRVTDKWAVLSQGGVNNMGSLTLAAG